MSSISMTPSGNLTGRDILTFSGFEITSSKINGMVVVDGVKYPQTSTGINSALAAQSSGGIVFLPKGNYTINSQILISTDYISLVADDWGTVFNVANNTNATIIKVTSDYVTLRGFKMLCNGTNQSGVFVNKGINFLGATYGLVERIWVQDPYDVGIQFENTSDHGTARDCKIMNRTQGSYSADCLVAQNSAFCFFENNYCDTTPNASDNGIGIFSNTTAAAGRGCRVIGNVCTNNGAFGINAEDVENCTIQGNYSFGNRGGISVHDSGLNATKVNIGGNVVYNCSEIGIFVDVNCKNIVIDGNTVHDCNDIGIYSGSANTIISNNVSYDNNLEGIKVFQADKCVISGNNCHDNDRAGTFNAGIELSDSDYCTVTGNNCTNTSTVFQDIGISLIGGSTLNTITGNTCQNTGEGIRIDDCSRNNATGNVLTGNSYGVRTLSSADYNIICLNQVYNNSVAGISNVGANDLVQNNQTL